MKTSDQREPTSEKNRGRVQNVIIQPTSVQNELLFPFVQVQLLLPCVVVVVVVVVVVIVVVVALVVVFVVAFSRVRKRKHPRTRAPRLTHLKTASFLLARLDVSSPLALASGATFS